MHDIISARGVVWLGACIACGFLLLAIHMLMKIRMVIQALPGAWLLNPREDRLTLLKYREEAISRGWGRWPVWAYETVAATMLLCLLMVAVNELILKTPHYPEAEFHQVFLRWRAGRAAKLEATPAQAVEAEKTKGPEASGKKEPAAGPAKTPPANPPKPK